MLKEGDQAPDFRLMDSDRGERTLADFRGAKLVLYFYPQDDTPGCTKEACGLRDVYSEIRRLGATVVGVSPDEVESHVAFRDKYSLPFLLLADPERKAIDAYGAWGERVRSDGSVVIGVIRSTYVLDETGRIAKIYPKADPESHAAEILGFLRDRR